VKNFFKKKDYSISFKNFKFPEGSSKGDFFSSEGYTGKNPSIGINSELEERGEEFAKEDVDLSEVQDLLYYYVCDLNKDFNCDTLKSPVLLRKVN